MFEHAYDDNNDDDHLTILTIADCSITPSLCDHNYYSHYHYGIDTN